MFQFSVLDFQPCLLCQTVAWITFCFRMKIDLTLILWQCRIYKPLWWYYPHCLVCSCSNIQNLIVMCSRYIRLLLLCYKLLFTAHCPFQNRMNCSDVYTEDSSLLLKGTFLFIMWQSFSTRNISNLLITNKLSASVYGKDCNTCWHR